MMCEALCGIKTEVKHDPFCLGACNITKGGAEHKRKQPQCKTENGNVLRGEQRTPGAGGKEKKHNWGSAVRRGGIWRHLNWPLYELGFAPVKTGWNGAGGISEKGNS